MFGEWSTPHLQLLLSDQADFKGQKSRLEEVVEERGHIAFFLPKFHCELNYIELYWAQVKHILMWDLVPSRQVFGPRLNWPGSGPSLDLPPAAFKKALDSVPSDLGLKKVRIWSREKKKPGIGPEEHEKRASDDHLQQDKPEARSHPRTPSRQK